MRVNRRACLVWLSLAMVWPGGAAAQTAGGDARDAIDLSGSFDGTGDFVKKFAGNVLLDQKAIWTSPCHINRHNAKWWVLAGVTTAGLLAADHPLSQTIPFAGTSRNVGTDVSRIGQWYAVFPVAGALYAEGALSNNSKLRLTGLESLEALADADIVTNVVKVVARRQRPAEGDHGGHFEKGGASFPSGHSTQAWALAAVIADEYGDRRWVPFVSYGYAASVSVARMLAQAHFSSDVFVGGAIGFFVGRYVVGTQHLHEQHAALQHLLPKRAGWLMPTTVMPSVGAGGGSFAMAWNH